MKCQACDAPATMSVTEVADGKAVTYQVCEQHALELDTLQGKIAASARKTVRLFSEAGFLEACGDADARRKLAAHLLPGLCLALTDESPNVRIQAALGLMGLGPDAASALPALRDAAGDADERVRRAAEAAIELIESQEPLF
jgi:hypothetical protein